MNIPSAASFVLALNLVFIAAPVCRADGLASLGSFLAGTQGARAQFSQVVTSPLKVGETAPRTKTTSGSFEFQRPNRFRFFTQKPFEQSIVSDGQTLWMHDPDLNQVTQKPWGVARASTPVMLIASASTVVELEKVFALKALPTSDGLQWVQATPRSNDAQVQKIEIGLRNNAGVPQLEQWVVTDSFGQRAHMSLRNIQVNPKFSGDTFKFKIPMGADVLAD